MREIKFRVWNDYSKHYTSLSEAALYGIIRPYGNELKNVSNTEMVIEQFTGLKDKNGKEIYEGDICKWTHEFSGGEFLEKVEHQKINGVIVWAEQVGKFMFHDTDNNHWDFKRIQTNQCLEIIGNIHEALLK